MNEKSLKVKDYEMRCISESFAWLIKDKLVSIDNMTRAMQAEMATVGVPLAMSREYLPRYFNQLLEQVKAEQAERYEVKHESTICT